MGYGPGRHYPTRGCPSLPTRLWATAASRLPRSPPGRRLRQGPMASSRQRIRCPGTRIGSGSALLFWRARRDSNPRPSDPKSAPGRPRGSARVRQAFHFTREWHSKCPLQSGGVRGYPRTICCQICCQAACPRRWFQGAGLSTDRPAIRSAVAAIRVSEAPIRPALAARRSSRARATDADSGAANQPTQRISGSCRGTGAVSVFG